LKRSVYKHLFLSCKSPAGIVKTSVRTLSVATGRPGKEIEQAMDDLAADRKIEIHEGMEIVLLEFPEYMPILGTISQTLEIVGRELDRTKNQNVRECVRKAFGSLGISIREANPENIPVKTRQKKIKDGEKPEILPEKDAQKVSGETKTDMPAIPASLPALGLPVRFEKRHALSVSEEEVDLYAEIFKEYFGDIAPLDETPGERMGLPRNRRLMVKHRIAELGPDWEKKHTDTLEKARRSPFLCGKKTTFRLTFSWLTARRENSQKIREGQYDDAESSRRASALGNLREFAQEQGIRGLQE